MAMEKIENKFITLWIEDGIVCGLYTRGATIDLEAARRIVADRLALCAGKDYPSLTIANGIKSITKEARDYFSQGDGVRGMTRLAVLTESPISNMIGNFWLQINKPTVPTRLFTNREDAIAWLTTDARS